MMPQAPQIFAHHAGLQSVLSQAFVCWTFSDVGNPQPGHEAQSFVEGMHPRVHSPTLHEHMMAVARPCVGECGLNDGTTVSAPAQVGMSDDVLQEAMAPSAAQDVRCRYEHACCGDAVTFLGYKDVDTRLRQGLMPNALNAVARFSRAAHLRRGEQR